MDSTSKEPLSERKRIREKRRRSEFNKALNDLGNLLHEIDSPEVNFTNGLPRRTQQSRKNASLVKNRVDLITYAITVLERLRKESESLTLEIQRVERKRMGNLRDSAIPNLLLSGKSSLIDHNHAQHHGTRYRLGSMLAENASYTSQSVRGQLNRRGPRTLSTLPPVPIDNMIPVSDFRSSQSLRVNPLSSLGSSSPLQARHSPLHTQFSSRQSGVSAEYISLLKNQDRKALMLNNSLSGRGSIDRDKSF